MSKRARDDTLAYSNKCPGCEVVNDAISPTEKGNTPDIGSLCMCLYCGFPSVVARIEEGELLLREPSKQEWLEILEDDHLLLGLALRAKQAKLRAKQAKERKS